MTNNDTFLPPDYQVPQGTGSYMKFKQGQNKFRILSAPILGYEYWTDDNKPVRAPELWSTIPLNARLPWEPKHFWAMAVYSYEAKAVQILEITQKSVLVEIQNLVQNDDWGDPRGYNIMVTRKGEGLKTEYSVMPSAHSKLPDEVKRMYEDAKIDLNALFDGGNPMEAEERGEEIDAKDFRPSIVKGTSEDESFAQFEEIDGDEVPLA